MLTPGDNYVNSPVTIAANFQTRDGDDVDPDTVTLKLFSPSQTETSYVYQTDDELVRVDTGDYYIDVTPDESGRWFYRWETTGANKTIGLEGSFVVKASVFYDDAASDAYRS